jgi:hypothetical protein
VSKMNAIEHRLEIREYWKKKFSASKNYNQFCELLLLN